MEAVSHYPILSAVAGIVLGLVEPEMAQKRRLKHEDPSSPPPPATRALLSDPSFQMSALAAMLGRTPPMLTPTSPGGSVKPKPDKVFNFRDCEYSISKFQMIICWFVLPWC
jgi:hypothetical protein